MGILSVILLGLIVGALAKFIMPGDDPGGIFITIGIGIAGALVGGFIANMFGIAPTDDFSVGGIATATAGALLLLFGYRKMKS